jgi:hypothetical protein
MYEVLGPSKVQVRVLVAARSRVGCDWRIHRRTDSSSRLAVPLRSAGRRWALSAPPGPSPGRFVAGVARCSLLRGAVVALYTGTITISTTKRKVRAPALPII